MKNLSRKQRKMLFRIVLAAVLLAVAELALTNVAGVSLLWLLYLLPYAVIGWEDRKSTRLNSSR